MPDVSSNAPADVRLWVSLDVHKLSIVAATLPPTGGQPEVCQIETTRVAVRRFIERLGGPRGLAVCYEAGRAGSTCCACSRSLASPATWSPPR